MSRRPRSLGGDRRHEPSVPWNPGRRTPPPRISSDRRRRVRCLSMGERPTGSPPVGPRLSPRTPWRSDHVHRVLSPSSADMPRHPYVNPGDRRTTLPAAGTAGGLPDDWPRGRTSSFDSGPLRVDAGSTSRRETCSVSCSEQAGGSGWFRDVTWHVSRHRHGLLSSGGPDRGSLRGLGSLRVGHRWRGPSAGDSPARSLLASLGTRCSGAVRPTSDRRAGLSPDVCVANGPRGDPARSCASRWN